VTIFGSTEDLIGIILTGCLCYISLIILLRISGKRTLSKMNMFDWVITVALGSTMASALRPDAVILNVVAAFATLVGAQFVVTTLSTKFTGFNNLINASPTLLYYKGSYLQDAMSRERVPKVEILSAIRQSGQGAPSDIAAVILESNGELIVMNKVDSDQTETLEQAENWNRVAQIISINDNSIKP